MPPTGDSDDAMLIGIYESDESARGAITRLRDKPGFRDHPNVVEDTDQPGFIVESHELGKDGWSDGYQIEHSEGEPFVLPAWMSARDIQQR